MSATVANSNAVPPTGITARSTPASASMFSVHLDMIRGVSALVVLFGHGRNLLFGNYVPLTGAAGFVHHQEGTRGFGDQAVIVFFVLSGYLIGTGVLGAVRAGTWSWREYLLTRICRLWVVLVPALLLGALWDFAGLHFYGGSHLYLGYGTQTVLEGSTLSRLSPRVLLGNYLFLQTISVPYFGTNRALWSLAYEFWFYMLFPLIALTFSRRTSPRSRLLYALFSVLIAWFVGPSVLEGFVLWLCGVGVSLIPALPEGKAAYMATCVSSLLLIVVVIVTRVVTLPVFAANIALAVTCGGLLYGLRRYRHPCPFAPYKSVAHNLARSSYTLYLVHLPPLVFLAGALHAPWQARPASAGYYLLIIVGLLLYANVMYLLFEANTGRMRRLADQWLHPLLLDRLHRPSRVET